jgi:transposase
MVSIIRSEWLKPIYRQIKEQTMSGPCIQVDETPINYLDPGNGKTGLGYRWVAHRPGEDVLFEWHTSREAKCLDQLIPIGFSGTVQCDGYSAYERFAKRRVETAQRTGAIDQKALKHPNPFGAVLLGFHRVDTV